ncbi:1569_t:CDS:2 [Cetraspora pellucida]|uniref:1569_t:CDS:1 n=1 Tax=Cetraspora pellucida TaxID=1433469 RepID=A0A9N8VSH8_9GLOM|nr:1569_t:CDS:2 [Cetraspora pellucida]
MSLSINCFWSLLSLRDLSFVYISPWLSKALGPDHDSLLGTSVFDYFHPQDRELARRDLSECRYNNISAIKKKLQSQQSQILSNKGFPSSKLSTTYQDDDNDYIIMNLGMNVVSHDIVLACFHPDDAKPSNCSQNSCGETEFTSDLSSLLRKNSSFGFSKVQTPPATPFPENKSLPVGNNVSSNRIFQILDRNSRNLIFTWPDPSFVSGTDISYDKDEFSRLLQNSPINNCNYISGKDRIDTQSPNCMRPISNKHTMISTCGKSQQVESLMIPYGVIIFACFQVLPLASSILFASPPYKPQKSLSAPCSPPTVNSTNKRPRSPNSSPGSLSPTYYSDSGSNGACGYNSGHPYPYRQEISEFIIPRPSKRICRPDDISPIPHHLPNPISPHNSPPVYQDQYSFSSMSQSQNDQKLPTISHQQIYFAQQHQQQNNHHNHHQYPPHPQHSSNSQQSSNLQHPPHSHSQHSQHSQHPQHPSHSQHSQHVNSYPSPTFLPQHDNNVIHQRSNPPPPPSSQPQPVQNQVTNFPQYPPPSQRRPTPAINGTKKCESCHTDSSPEWRRGPTGHKTYSRTIAREIRKREQAQREQEQRIREQREGEERARERAAAIMMQHVIEPPYNQYRPNANMTGEEIKTVRECFPPNGF